MQSPTIAKDVFRRFPWPDRRGLLRAGVCAAGFAIPVAVLAYAVREKVTPVLDMDESVVKAATDVTRRHPTFRTGLKVWEYVFEPWRLYIGAAAALGLVWWQTRLKTRVWWAGVTMVVAWGLQALLKLGVKRARPLVEDAVSHASGYSFPSGHGTNGAVVATAFTLLVLPVVKHRVARVVMPVSGALWVLMTCLDRVFLGVHFPSDVTAGTLLGVGMVLTSYFGFLGRSTSQD